MRVQHTSPKFLTPEILQEAKNNLRAIATNEQSHVPSSTNTKRAIDVQINQYRNLPPELKEALLPKLATRSLSISAPEVKGLYHHRDPSLNNIPFFFSGYETEKPELDAIQKLPEKAQDFYKVRHLCKRGRDLLTDEPIEGESSTAGRLKTSPHMKGQGWVTRALRGEAATATVAKYGKEYIKNLHAKVIASLDLSRTDNTVHVVRPSRSAYCDDYTLNFLTFATQTELARTLNDIGAKAAKEAGRSPVKFADHKCLYGLSRTARTEASPIGRLVQQPYFVTSELNAGDKMIIADDHVQAGGSILSMLSAAKEANIDVLAVATLTTHPFSKQFSMSDDVKALLDKAMKKWDKDGLIGETLSEIGMPLHTLTNHEAMILIAYATDPKDADALAAFSEVEKRLLDGSASVMEGEHDSLKPVLSEAPRTPEEIVAELHRVGSEARKIIKDTPIREVHVLDWDDFLRDEKGMNYQLMHNALAITANAYKDKHPQLQKIADAVLRQSHHDDYREGMPKLCMMQEQFAKYAIANPQFFKRHIVIDLMDSISTLDAGIEISKEQREKMINIIYTEFTRQYKQLVSPVSSLRDKGKDVKLPYPDVKLSMMPGAKGFLDKIRNPDARTILISNRGHGDLEKEINKLQMAHYFDWVSGTPEMTIPKSGSAGEEQQASNTEAHPDTTMVKRIHGKPSAYQLRQAFDHLSIPSGMNVTLWGDTPKDVTQALDMKNALENSNVRGVVVNPGMHEKVEAARQEVKNSGLTLPIDHIDKLPA
ncbi:MAG TPA: hypothetical protein VF427_10000 [Noviherbaspirillum sp.]